MTPKVVLTHQTYEGTSMPLSWCVQVRETSRKPDEMYSLIERLSPGTRKLEIFARQHNVRPGWVSLGNQLDGVKIMDPEMKARYEAKYVSGS